MKKPVVRSPLERLPLYQKQALLAWLTTGGKEGIGVTYEEARKRLFAEFKVKTHSSALHFFYRRNRKLPTTAPQIDFDPTSNTVTIVIRLPSPTSVLNPK